MKAGAFCLVIVLGYLLKRRGFFKASDFPLLSKIVINITLPCAVVSNFSKLSVDFSLLILTALGVAFNLILIGAGWLSALNKRKTDRAFAMLNTSGFNIGCFALPYVQSFVGPSGVVAACLFDAGNSLLCTGGTYALASSMLGGKGRAAWKGFLRKLFSSVPLDTYVVMLLLAALRIPVPAPVTVFTDLAGAGNGFLAMLMIGVGFELRVNREQLGRIGKVLAIRYGLCVGFALLCRFCIPLPPEMLRVLLVVVFAPVASLMPAFTGKCGGDVALASAINSVSIVISILVMTGLLLV